MENKPHIKNDCAGRSFHRPDGVCPAVCLIVGLFPPTDFFFREANKCLLGEKRERIGVEKAWGRWQREVCRESQTEQEKRATHALEVV